jgi:hypothetical protein
MNRTGRAQKMTILTIETWIERQHQKTHKIRAACHKQNPWNAGFQPTQADEHVIRYYYLSMGQA